MALLMARLTVHKLAVMGVGLMVESKDLLMVVSMVVSSESYLVKMSAHLMVDNWVGPLVLYWAVPMVA